MGATRGEMGDRACSSDAFDAGVGPATIAGSAPGEVAEWLNAPVSKTGMALVVIGSSNLPLSAF